MEGQIRAFQGCRTGTGVGSKGEAAVARLGVCWKVLYVVINASAGGNGRHVIPSVIAVLYWRFLH